MSGAAGVGDALGWQSLPRPAQVYVAVVVLAGATAVIAFFPGSLPRPFLFFSLVIAACLTSTWKVSLPIPLVSGSTLSVAYAANLAALLLLGTSYAVLVAVAGTWTQCVFRPRQRYPLYRTIFSAAAVALTMAVTGVVFEALGGAGPLDLVSLSRPLVGAIATCFIVNTGLVAGAIALSTGQTVWGIWHNDFLLGGASFMVAGSAGAAAAIIIDRGQQWTAVLMVAPVYLTYRTYQLFVGRLEDEARHLAEVRVLHQEAVAARASAEEANRLKDQFLAIVSHELRTPLNAILGWSDILRRGGLEGSRLERATRAISDSAKRQAQIIDELLDVARIISGKLRLESIRVELGAIVKSAVDIVQPVAAAKGLQVTVEASATGAVEGDSARLQQIIWNLLSNAVKFTPEGGHVLVRLRENAGYAVVSVTDTGRGIAREFLPFVFEPFRQADGSTTRLHGGLGLGLSIARQLIEAHGGSIAAESEGEGHGATFSVCLPLARPETAPAVAAPASTPALVPPLSLRGVRVLVVDDDEASRHVVAAQLEDRGATIYTAATAADAFELLQRLDVHVLLADVAMPGEDGYSLLRRLRSFSPATAALPAAALTAFAREQDREQALAAGFQLHLAKPVDPDTLVAAVVQLGRVKATESRQRR